jgi:hypothetical protein
MLVVPNPKIRRAMAGAERTFQRKPMIHGLIEVDVTRARAFLIEVGLTPIRNKRRYLS